MAHTQQNLTQVPPPPSPRGVVVKGAKALDGETDEGKSGKSSILDVLLIRDQIL